MINLVLESLFSVLGDFIQLGILYFVISVSRKYTFNSDKPPSKCYLNALIFSAIMGLIAWQDNGIRTENPDYMFGGGEEYQAFETTPEKQIKSGIKIFLFCLGASSIGVYFGLIKRGNTPDEEKKP